MWIDFFKIVLCFCIFYNGASVALNYHETKQDYINRQRQYWLKRNEISVTSRPTLKSPHTNTNYDLGENKVRHQSRFTKFDTVRRMIDSRTITTSPKPILSYVNGRRRHFGGWGYNYKTTLSDDELFDNNSDVEDEEYDDEDAEEDDVDDDFYLDDEDDDAADTDDNLFDWQAEETTTVKMKPVQSQYHSSFTDVKWTHLGTRERVEETRTQIMQKNSSEETGVKAFLQHFMRVKQEGQCRRPLPKVISVQSEHPDPSKTYTPHCTVLHRCADDTGCCKHNTKCQYKTRHLVHLYFYAKTIGSSATKVEKLSFYNHTECECGIEDSTSGITLKSSTNTYRLPIENLQRCKCPEVFIPKIKYDDYSCTCDCEDDNQDCQRMKKGKEHFGLTDRMCISNKSCGVPVCEYGSYLKLIGRCPKKLEKLEDFKRFKMTSVT